MDKIYQILKTNSSSINYILLACAAFSSITTLERADYNLFLFLFIAYTMFWDNENLKQNKDIIIFERKLFTIILAISLLVDIIWIYSNSKICSSFIIYFSWIELFIKIILIGVTLIMWQGFKKECLIINKGEIGFQELEEA